MRHWNRNEEGCPAAARNALEMLVEAFCSQQVLGDNGPGTLCVKGRTGQQEKVPTPFNVSCTRQQ